MKEILDSIKFDAHGLIPAIIQDYDNGQVLMMAWMNEESIIKTLETRKTHFYSRSRKKLWLKGESSGHVQHVKSFYIDCDADTILIKVTQVEAACHEGFRSCFFRKLDMDTNGWVEEGTRLFDPKQVYGKS